MLKQTAFVVQPCVFFCVSTWLIIPKLRFTAVTSSVNMSIVLFTLFGAFSLYIFNCTLHLHFSATNYYNYELLTRRPTYLRTGVLSSALAPTHTHTHTRTKFKCHWFELNCFSSYSTKIPLANVTAADCCESSTLNAPTHTHTCIHRYIPEQP